MTNQGFTVRYTPNPAYTFPVYLEITLSSVPGELIDDDLRLEVNNELLVQGEWEQWSPVISAFSSSYYDFKRSDWYPLTSSDTKRVRNAWQLAPPQGRQQQFRCIKPLKTGDVITLCAVDVRRAVWAVVPWTAKFIQYLGRESDQHVIWELTYPYLSSGESRFGELTGTSYVSMSNFTVPSGVYAA